MRPLLRHKPPRQTRRSLHLLWYSPLPSKFSSWERATKTAAVFSPKPTEVRESKSLGVIPETSMFNISTLLHVHNSRLKKASPTTLSAQKHELKAGEFLHDFGEMMRKAYESTVTQEAVHGDAPDIQLGDMYGSIVDDTALPEPSMPRPSTRAWQSCQGSSNRKQNATSVDVSSNPPICSSLRCKLPTCRVLARKSTWRSALRWIVS